MVKGINVGKTLLPSLHWFAKHAKRACNMKQSGATNAERLSTKPLEIVYLGVCGPMRTTSVGGTKCFVIFVDNFLRKSWVYTMKCKG